MDIKKVKTIQQSMGSQRIKRLAESVFGRNNISVQAVIYAALLLLAIAWLPVGIADFIDDHWLWFSWLPCSYKLLVSLAIFVICAPEVSPRSTNSTKSGQATEEIFNCGAAAKASR